MSRFQQVKAYGGSAMQWLVLTLVLILFSGCAGAVPWNTQNYAGITHVDVEFSPTYDSSGNATGHYVSRIRWWDGKEKQEINVKAIVGSGQVVYGAGGVKAFPGFETRAAAETTVAKFAKEAGVEILPKMLDVLLKSLGLP